MATSITVKKETLELMKKAKRKMSFDRDKDISNDEFLTELLESYIDVDAH